MTEFRVRGQPINDMKLKYKSTYSRASKEMIWVGASSFRELSILGLLATNSREISNHIQSELSSYGFKSPSVRERIVVERDSTVVGKILAKEKKYPGEGRLRVINSNLRNITHKKGTCGRPPLASPEIYLLQEELKREVNFFDFDLMNNWKQEWEFNCVPEIVSLYSSRTSILHINAVSHIARTNWLASTESEVEEIVHKKIIQPLENEFYVRASEAISYITNQNASKTNKNTTTMTSVVLTVRRK